MHRLVRAALAGSTVIVSAIVLSGGASPAQAAGLKRVATIEIPGQPLASFDIGFVDQEKQIYYLADRSNSAVDMIDAKSGKFIGRIGGFAGPTSSTKTAGPNGVVVFDNGSQLWATNGDSSVKVIDLKASPPKIVASISTGGKKRVDELAVDEKDGLALVINDADEPPFASLISTKSDHKILAKIEMADASDGVEQPVWDAATGRFYVSVPVVKGDKAKGAIAVIDPKAMKVVAMHPVSECMPAGLALGPDQHLLLGCSGDAIEAGFKPKSVVMNAKDGAIVATISEVGGSDEVWYDAKNGRYYLAARDMPGGPVLGVIDAKTNKWIENVPTAKNAHSVAANGANGHVFVPLTPNPACANGCVGVYASE